MHVRCPHCHNAIEIVKDSSFRDVACPSCGSHFNLVSLTPTESGPIKVARTGALQVRGFFISGCCVSIVW